VKPAACETQAIGRGRRAGHDLEEEMDVATEKLDHFRAGLDAKVLDHADEDLLLPGGFDEDGLFDANRPVGLLLVRHGLHV